MDLSEFQNFRTPNRSTFQATEILKDLLKSIERLPGAAGARVWMGAEFEQLIELCVPDFTENVPAASLLTPDPETIVAALQQRTSLYSSEFRHRADQPSSNNRDRSSTFWVMTPILGRHGIHGLIYGEFSLPPGDDSIKSTLTRIEELAAQATASLESHHVAPDTNTGSFENTFHDFCTELHSEPAISTTSAVIAAEYLRLFQPARTWVLMPSVNRWRVKSVGGIPSFQRRSNVVRKLENVVDRIVKTGKPFHWIAGTIDRSISPRTQQSLDEYLDEAHVSQIRIEPLQVFETSKALDRSKAVATTVGVVVCEWFQPAQCSFSESQWKNAREQAGIALQNAEDWSRAPVANLLRTWRRRRSWRWLAGWGTALALGSVGLYAAATVPMDFTIDARGQVQPVQRRHIFATTAGIVRSLAVETGQPVNEGDLLLELDSPELELEIRRVEGELGTTKKRIHSIEASRLDFGLSSPDSINQMNTLAGELKELQQKRENLIHEIDVLSQRRDELKVLSPIKGRVVTWDVERLLSRRPVSRGQRLLTVSDADGPWEIELLVADEDTSDLFRAMKEQKAVPIDFIVVTLPGKIYTTTLRSVSDTIEVRSFGEAPTLLCQADAPEQMANTAIEGMSIRGRIHCGRRPAIAVMFEKFWRAVREHLLFRWGW